MNEDEECGTNEDDTDDKTTQGVENACYSSLLEPLGYWCFDSLFEMPVFNNRYC